MTPQRQAILKLINASDQHWDAEALSREMATQGHRIGIATMYRGLAALESNGMIGSIQLAGKKHYERANKKHHDHMVCIRCGNIEEFINGQIEALQKMAADEKHFQMTGHQLTIFGICEACMKAES